MTESPKCVVILDDEEPMIDALRVRFGGKGWDVRSYTNSATFESVELSGRQPAVFIVDHDLGSGVVGYQVVQRLREARPDGLALPVVYLTGRESERGYLEARLTAPNLRPSVFVSKNKLASLDLVEVCSNLLDHYSQILQFEQIQTLRRAAADLARSIPEESDL
jgi:CheY-like chemotaxis protein